MCPNPFSLLSQLHKRGPRENCCRIQLPNLITNPSWCRLACVQNAGFVPLIFLCLFVSFRFSRWEGERKFCVPCCHTQYEQTLQQLAPQGLGPGLACYNKQMVAAADCSCRFSVGASLDKQKASLMENSLLSCAPGKYRGDTQASHPPGEANAVHSVQPRRGEFGHGLLRGGGGGKA